MPEAAHKEGLPDDQILIRYGDFLEEALEAYLSDPQYINDMVENGRKTSQRPNFRYHIVDEEP